jgi:hypothetical protein
MTQQKGKIIASTEIRWMAYQKGIIILSTRGMLNVTVQQQVLEIIVIKLC